MRKVVKHMQVILMKDVPGLGQAGQVKKVRPGFGRNFLIPQKLAVLPGNPEAVQLAANKKGKVLKGTEKEKTQALRLASIEGKKFIFKAKADAKGKLYGSIGPKEIAQKIGIDESLLLDKHFKKIGVFPLEIGSGKDLKAKVEIVIEKEK